MASLFEKDIQFLKGVGSKRKVLFKKLKVPTIGAFIAFLSQNLRRLVKFY